MEGANDSGQLNYVIRVTRSGNGSSASGCSLSCTRLSLPATICSHTVPPFLPAMAAQRLREILPRPGLPKPNPIRETLSKLGLTEEQFKAKQTEMMEVLLRNQPFVPKEPSAAQKAPQKLSTDFYERMVAGSSGNSRSRSESVSSSSSSRDPSPAPRTPARREQPDAATQRPRDKMELIIEQRNRAKSDRRKGV